MVDTRLEGHLNGVVILLQDSSPIRKAGMEALVGGYGRKGGVLGGGGEQGGGCPVGVS
jgi:hypothetical protein